ncbi:aminoacyl-tRNA deacylase [Rhabdaerophilum sp.]|uniref:aminoacyl-tRNA deacylase n=1 Tax=Rhabdaerophilum sp. TaxID=2717341 RepID=UPI0038D4C34B
MTSTQSVLNNFIGMDATQVSAAAEVKLEEVPVAVRRVIDTAMRGGIPYSLRRLPAEAVDPQTIAAACGTEPSALLRAIVFRGKTTKKPMLVLASATTNVGERALAQIVGEVLERVDAATTERITGFPPECLPPFLPTHRLPIIMDETLVNLGRVWCMAGSPDLIMSVPTKILTRVIAARIARIDSSR